MRLPTPSRRWLGWVIVGAVALAALGVLWAAGGLRKAPPRMGERMELGQSVDTLRWRVAVTGVGVATVDEYDKPFPAPRVRVTLAVVNLGTRSEYEVPTSLIVLRRPTDGATLVESECRREPRGKLDPLVWSMVVCDFAFSDAAGEIRLPASGERLPLQVAVMDQEASGDLVNNPDEITVSAPTAYYPAEVVLP